MEDLLLSILGDLCGDILSPPIKIRTDDRMRRVKKATHRKKVRRSNTRRLRKGGANNNEDWTIYLQRMSGERIPIAIQKDDKVRSLRQKIKQIVPEYAAISPGNWLEHRLKLVRQLNDSSYSEPLKSSQEMEEAGVKNGDRLHVIYDVPENEINWNEEAKLQRNNRGW
jgi:hypothetical protein